MSASDKKKLRKEERTAQLTEKQLAQKKEARKLKAITTVFVVAIALILVASLAIAGLNIYKGSGLREKHTIAAVIGEHEINSVEMSYYYADTIDNNYQRWSSAYGDSLSLYLSLMGLDPTLPLSEQTYTDGVTWADYFVDIALDSARSDYLLADKAAAEGFTITEESQLTLDNTMEMLPAFASMYGYADVNTYLHAMYGPGSNLESYRAYAERSALASDYYNAYAETLPIDDAAIRAYEEGRYDEYSSFSYANYTLSYSYFQTGGTQDEDGNTSYSDEEKDAARLAAKAAAESLPQCATAEELNAAIAALGLPESAPTEATVHDGALYTTLNSNVRQWMADADRKEGDFTVVANETTTTDESGAETTVISGYTAYVFTGRNDNTKPMANVRHILVAFEGGTTDDTGVTTYSEEEKNAAKEKAENLLQMYIAGGPSEEAFAELATANTDDTSSSANGGLYEDITTERGIYVDSFTDWANDLSREAGDTGIIESEYGYHVMYYVGDDELSYRDHMIREEILETSLADWYDDILATADITEKDTSLLNREVVLSQ